MKVALKEIFLVIGIFILGMAAGPLFSALTPVMADGGDPPKPGKSLYPKLGYQLSKTVIDFQSAYWSSYADAYEVAVQRCRSKNARAFIRQSPLDQSFHFFCDLNRQYMIMLLEKFALE